MQGLRSKVLTFSKELQDFSQQLSNGVEELKRSARAKPCVGATAFRENFEELKERTSGLEGEISELDRVTPGAVTVEDLLSRCLAQLVDNDKRVAALESHLQEYGYKAKFLPPSKPEAFSHPEEAGPKDSEATPPLGTTPLWEEPKRRRSFSSPGLLTDDALGLNSTQQALRLHFPSVTPSPIPSTVPSINSISPSLRELQIKYGQSGMSDSSPDSQQTNKNAAQSKVVGDDVPAQAASTACTASSLDKQLGDLTFDTPSLKMPHKLQETGNFADPNSPLVTSMNPDPPKVLTIQTGKKNGSSGDSGSPKVGKGSNSTPLGKGDIIASRLAAGEAPWDMLSLKAAITDAVTGSGQVGEAIGSAAFHPQAAAFTSLLHMCAKHKLWQKALEVFEGMKKYHPGVVPNTVHFSSLISACGTAGRWQEAMQVFEEMKRHSLKDPQCKPNVITYSALMTACCAGGRPDKAHEAFLDMKARGIQPDHISYSTLIAGFERWGDLEKAKSLFEEMKETGLLQKANGPASKVPTYLEQFNRKLLRTSSKASIEEQESGKGGGPGHRTWNSFGSNGGAGDSPFIGAHYGSSAVSRGPSNDLAAMDDDACIAPLRNELLHLRTPSRTGFTEGPTTTPLVPHAVFSMAQQTPMHRQPQPSTPTAAQMMQDEQSWLSCLQAARSRHRSHMRSSVPSPLSHSFDGSHIPGFGGMVPPPPGFGGPLDSLQVAAAVEPGAGGFGAELQHLASSDASGSQTFDAETLQQLANTSGMDLASQLLGAFVQQQAIMQPAGPPGMSPLPAVHQEAFVPPAPKTANGAPQIAQITVQEYNNLPLRFSRQLSLDQMNEAVDYVNAVVEGKKNNKATADDQANGVIPQELVPLELGNQRTTALLNCLLQLKRVRLTVKDGQQHYLLLSN